MTGETATYGSTTTTGSDPNTYKQRRDPHEAERYVSLLRRRPGTDWSEVVRRALREDDLYVTWTVLEEVPEQLEVALLEELSRHITDAIRSLVALASNTPSHVLQRLADDDDVYTRRHARENLNRRSA